MLFCRFEGVCGVKRLKSYREGKEQDSVSALLEFSGELPARVFLDDVSHRLRAFERVLLRCYWCRDYGRVVAVCGRRVHRCRRCGKGVCSVECKLTDEVICIHCGG